MFEQSTLASGPNGKRVWTAILGVTSQVVLVGGAVMVPIIWPQVMPHSQLMAIFLPPVPPGPPAKGEPEKPVTRARAVPRTEFHGFVAPSRIPTSVPVVVDEPVGTVVGSPNGDSRATGVGVPDGFFSDLPVNAIRVEPPVIRAAVALPVAPKLEPVVTKQYRVGGDVKLGRLLRKVEPAYPPIAKAAHVSGVVQLEAVVGTDGRVHSVRVLGGSALLARAAQDAVMQWVYEPSKLNDVLIEVVANIAVTFTLN
jgi:periplasmic protein TonB